MKKFAFILSLVMGLGFAALANANLIDNGCNLLYDDDLDITWYAVASNSGMPWNEAMSWTNSLNYGNVSGWQLPLISEMSHLYYDELGNVMFGGLVNVGPFSNLHATYFWSREEIWITTSDSRARDFSFGGFGSDMWIKSAYDGALAVHYGNVAVPEPAAMLLFTLGLIGLAGVRRKLKK